VTTVGSRPVVTVLRRHWLLIALLLAGTTFRVLVGGLRTVVIVQHLVGLAMAVLIYHVALRHGARRWLAALATAPVLLDAYQWQIEQNIMSDVWLQFLLVVLFWLLVATAAPRPWRAGVAGVVLGIAVLMRTVALPVVLPVLAYLVVAGAAWRSRAGWLVIARRVGALVACFGFVLFCYAGYFHREAGHWGLTGSTSDVLYGRAAEVADCSRLDLDPVLRQLCPAEPLGSRRGVDWYSHLDGDSRWPGDVPPGTTVDRMEHDFAVAVVRAQPFDVARDVLVDFAKGFEFGRTSAPTDVSVRRWQFQTYYPIWAGSTALAVDATTTHGGQPPTVYPRLALFLRDYQLAGGYMPGPALALCGIVGLVGGFGARRRSGIRAATMLATGMAGTVLFVSAMFEFSWRYQLPGLVLLPIAGVLGVTVLIGALRRPQPGKQRRRMLAPFPDVVDSSAIAAFGQRYGRPTFAPVLVVIAAYNEEDGIGGVLDNLPTTCLDLPVDVLVVVDGAGDGTAGVAMAHGAYTCVAPTNRGQGAALRLGYQLAAYGGARYVITTDADGQYDNAEMPLLLEPLVAGTHDFVTGSRRLGAAPSDDRVRWLGVRVYATLASLLAWRRITDTSFGFRGLRTELACSVPLRQPQYQASELLLGALAGGARFVERPMTMRVRSAGTTKKGNNLVYGINYGSVMTWTWLREYVGRRLLRLAGIGRRRSGAQKMEQPANS
jgi:hypothetical protein